MPFEFDIVMPLALFFITLASVFLNQKTESKLKSSLEERTFGMWDTVLLVAGMAVMVYLIVIVRTELALMVIFLFSYSMLLFLFTYVFSKNRWYLAAIPPAMFVVLYALTRQTTIWDVYLINVYAVIFAVMITLYLQSLFTWKTSLVFVGLITAVDVVLVLVTGWMVSAANTTRSLQLPVLVTLPTFPPLEFPMGLGLGDFFFAGLLAIQAFKRFGRRFALASLAAMSISFFLFETYMLTFRVTALPGTVMILVGWIVLIGVKMLADIMSKTKTNQGS